MNASKVFWWWSQKSKEDVISLDDVADLNKKVIDVQLARLKDYCESDEYINRIVHLLIQDNYDSELDPLDAITARVLHGFVFSLGYSVSTNPFSSSDTLYNLASFIGNYFRDDSCFVIDTNSTDVYAACRPATDQDDVTSQSARFMIEQAERIAKYIHLEQTSKDNVLRLKSK